MDCKQCEIDDYHFIYRFISRTCISVDIKLTVCKMEKLEYNPSKKIWMLVPVFGALLFLGLYITSTFLYPGGSQMDRHAVGFSWLNNYWCNLLDNYALNGKLNPAKPFAMAGMVVLCLTIAFFWVIFPKHVESGKGNSLMIQLSGSLSMTVAMFISTELHDQIITIAGLFGVITIIGSFIILYKIKWYGLLILGSINLFLLVLCEYFYHVKDFMVYLPVVQKISFFTYLIWICSMDLKFYNFRAKNASS